MATKSFSLPEGWVAYKDEGQGKYYYSKDGATVWDWPAEAGAKPEVTTDKWAFAKDPSSGNVYYYSKEDSSKTEWQPPAEVIEFVFGEKKEEKTEDADEAAAEGKGEEKEEEVKEEGKGDDEEKEEAEGATKTEEKTEEKKEEAGEEGEKEEEEKEEAAGAAGGGGAAGAAAGAAGADVPAENKMDEESKTNWLKLLENLKEEATIALKARRSRFERLRQIRAKKAREEAERAKKEAEEAKVEAAEFAKAEEAARRLTILSMTELPVPEKVPHKPLEEYVSDNCELRRKGLFKGETTVAKLMSHKKAEIKMPLRKFADKSAAERATQMNRNILSFMGDRSSSKDDGGHAEKLLKTLIINKVSDFNDEAYLQLCKQTTENPDKDSLLKGWQLFAILSGAVLPSEELYPYIRSYFFQAMESSAPGTFEEPSIHDYAKFALSRLERSKKMKVRTEVPPVMEIEATKTMSPVLVRVFFLDGTHVTMPATSTTGPIEMKNMVCELLGVSPPNAAAFGIYEVYPNNEERLIQEHERILDVVAFWQRIFEDAKQREGKDANRELPNRFVFKVQQYNTLKHKPTYDYAAEKLMYIQAVYDVVRDRYPCSEEQCLELAPIQRQAEKPRTDVSTDELGRYLKGAIIKARSPADRVTYAREINRGLAAIKGKTPRQCRRLYLEKVQKWKIYGSSFFVVNPLDVSRYGGEDTTLFLAINPKGVMVIRPESKELVAEFPYTQIPTWGFSSKAFVLQVGTLIHSEKHTFGSTSGAEMNALVKAYVNELIGTKDE